jgi:hypothetical protein
MLQLAGMSLCTGFELADAAAREYTLVRYNTRRDEQSAFLRASLQSLAPGTSRDCDNAILILRWAFDTSSLSGFLSEDLVACLLTRGSVSLNNLLIRTFILRALRIIN